MATTKIWPVKRQLGYVLRYAANEEKTELSRHPDLLGSALGSLPEGSELRMIEGGSHIMMYEKPCYHEFQNRIVEFLSSAEP